MVIFGDGLDHTKIQFYHYINTPNATLENHTQPAISYAFNFSAANI